jgi:hypothetical protein
MRISIPPFRPEILQRTTEISPKKSDDGCVKQQKCMEKPFGSHFKYQINYDF